MRGLEVVEIGPEAAAEVLLTIHAGFGARPELDPPSTALQETEESVRAALARQGGLVARLDDLPVGALIFDPHEDELGRQLGLRRVAVHPDAQSAGIATAMAAGAEAVATARGFAGVRLAARSELPNTVSFWRNRGYAELSHDGTTMILGKELPVTVQAPTADAMQDLGRRLAGFLRAGDMLILDGGLGAGKTTFTQGLGEGLEVEGPVTSPTFVIARVHESRAGGPALVHVDAYRLGDAAELDDLDLDTDLDDAVTVVEWGSGLAEVLAEDRLELRITRATGAEEGELRTVELVPVGARWVGAGLHGLA